MRGMPGSGGGKDVNVTARVQKYQGPHGDFYEGLGLQVRVHDMFPFDDHEDTSVRFAGLDVLDAQARRASFSYAQNDAVSMRGAGLVPGLA